MAMNMLMNPRNDRQRRTRDSLGAVAAYAAGSALRSMLNPSVPRPVKHNVTQIIRASHELKNFDQTAVGVTISGTAYNQYLLNPIAQGSGGSNRTGRKLRAEGIDARLILQKQTTATVDDVRIIIVRDAECRGSSLVLGDVLQVSTFGYAAMVSLLNFDSVPSRVHVLYDRTINLAASSIGNSGVTTWTGQDHVIDISVKQNQLCNYYNTSYGTVTDIESNAYYMFVLGTNASPNQTVLDYYLRFKFRDI